MIKNDIQKRTLKSTNKPKLSGWLSLDVRVIFKRVLFKCSKSKSIQVTLITSIIFIIGIIGALFRYMWIENGRLPSLSDPRTYVQWKQHEKALEEIDKLTKEIKAIKHEREEDNNVRDSLNVIFKELCDNWLIHILPSEEDKKSIEINKHVQRILRACREYNGPIDGNPYETYMGVINFQKKYKLKKKDAIIGPETWTTIINKLEEVKGEQGNLTSYAYPRL